MKPSSIDSADQNTQGKSVIMTFGMVWFFLKDMTWGCKLATTGRSLAGNGLRQMYSIISVDEITWNKTEWFR